MGKKIISLLLGTLAVGGVQAYTHQLDSIVRATDGGTSKFEPIFDAQMQATGYTHYVRSGNVWTNYARKQFQRDANGNDTAITTYLWNGGAWIEAVKEISVYDVQNQLVRNTVRQKADGVWIDSIESVYAYANGLLTAETHYKAQNGTLQNASKTEYTYDSDGNAVKTLNYSGQNGAWKVANQTIDTYADGKLAQSIFQIFSGGWLNSYKYEYAYAANKMSEKRYNYVSDTEWKLVAEKNYLYNDAGQETGYSETVFGSKKDSTTHDYTAQGDLEKYVRYAADSWEEAFGETYLHSGVQSDACVGATFAQQQITGIGTHARAVASFTRRKNGVQTYSDTYYMHSLQPTNLSANECPTDIYAYGGRIFGTNGMRIFTVGGMDVTAQNGSLHGIYIVKTGGKTAKVAVW